MMNSSLFKGLGVLALLVALSLAMTGCDPTTDMVNIEITSTEGGHVQEKVEGEWEKEEVEGSRSLESRAYVQLKAQPDKFFEFAGWEVDGASYGVEENLEKEEITVTRFTAGAKIKASFDDVREEYTVTFAEENKEQGVLIQIFADEALNEPVGDELTTGGDGEVTKDLLEGEYWFTAIKDGFEDFVEGEFLLDGADKKVPFTMVEEVVEEYRVTFKEENGLEDVSIQVFSDEGRTEEVGEELKTDNEGKAPKDLEDGNYWYTARLEGYEDHNGSFEVDGGSMIVSFTMKEIPKYEVTFSDPDNGTLAAEVDGDAISSGDEIYEGKDVEFKASPDEGYRVDKWIVNGEPVDGERGQTYTYENLDRDIDVEVELTEVIDRYEVTFTQPDNGTLTAEVDGTAISSGDEVEEGRDVVFTVDPDDDYYVQAWEVNGEEVDEETELTYTYTDLDEDIDVAVILFEAYAVTFSDPDNGELKAEVDDEEIDSGDLVEQGKDVLFTVDPDEGYEVEEWLVDDIVEEDETELTFTYSDLDKEIEVKVNLKLIKFDVTFEVTDEDGDPIEGATVDLEGEEETTDADGEAVFAVVPGEYDYTVSKADYQDKTGTVEVENEAITEEVTLGLSQYDVNFEVKDEDGDPIEGATVILNGEEETTDADGEAVFAMVPGEYDYTVSKADYQDKTGTVEVVDEDITEEVTLELSQYDVTFEVKDEDGDPIEGATVILNGEEETTDAAGEAGFTLLPEEYVYKVSKVGYEDETGTVEVVDEDITEEVTLELSQYDVTFTVIDEQNNAIEGAKVTIAGEEKETNVLGQAEFKVAWGDHEYIVGKEGFRTEAGSITVDEDKEKEVTLEESEISVRGTTNSVLDQGKDQYLEFVVTINDQEISDIGELEDAGYTIEFTANEDVLADDDDPTEPANNNKDGLVFYDAPLDVEVFYYEIVISEDGEDIADAVKKVIVLQPDDWMEVVDATLIKEVNTEWVNITDVLVLEPLEEKAKLRPVKAIQRDGEDVEPANDYLDDWNGQIESVSSSTDDVVVNAKNGDRIEVIAKDVNDQVIITVTLISGNTFNYELAVEAGPRKIERIEVEPDPIEITSTIVSADVGINVFDQYDAPMLGENITLVSGVDDDENVLFAFNPVDDNTDKEGWVEFEVSRENVDETGTYEIWVYDNTGTVPDAEDREDEIEDKIGKFHVEYTEAGGIVDYELQIHSDSPAQDYTIDAYLDGESDRVDASALTFQFVGLDKDGVIAKKATADQTTEDEGIITIDGFNDKVFEVRINGDIDAVEFDEIGTGNDTEIIELEAIKEKTGVVTVSWNLKDEVTWGQFDVTVEYKIPVIEDLKLVDDAEVKIGPDGGTKEISQEDLKDLVEVMMDVDNIDYDFDFDKMDNEVAVFEVKEDDHLLGFLRLRSSNTDIFTVSQNTDGVRLETEPDTEPEDQANIIFSLRDPANKHIDGSSLNLPLTIADLSGFEIEDVDEQYVGESFPLKISDATDIWGEPLGGNIGVVVESDLEGNIFDFSPNFTNGQRTISLTINLAGKHELTVDVDGVTADKTVEVMVVPAYTVTFNEEAELEGWTVTIYDDASKGAENEVDSVNADDAGNEWQAEIDLKDGDYWYTVELKNYDDEEDEFTVDGDPLQVDFTLSVSETVEVDNATDLKWALGEETVSTINLGVDPLDIDENDTTYAGQGVAEQTVHGNILVSGNNNTLEHFTLVGNLDVTGDNNDTNDVNVVSSSPGGNVTIDGDNNSLNDVSIDGDLSIGTGANNNEFQRVSVGGTYTDGGDNTTADISTDEYHFGTIGRGSVDIDNSDVTFNYTPGPMKSDAWFFSTDLGGSEWSGNADGFTGTFVINDDFDYYFEDIAEEYVDENYDPKGWVVDLPGHRGGAYEAMLFEDDDGKKYALLAAGRDDANGDFGLFSENEGDNAGFGLVRVEDEKHWNGGDKDDFAMGGDNHDPGTIHGAISDWNLTLIGVGYWTNNEEWDDN